MMETNEKHLLALAEAVTAEHGLGPVDVMSLADDVAEGVMRRTTYPSPGKLLPRAHEENGTSPRGHLIC